MPKSYLWVHTEIEGPIRKRRWGDQIIKDWPNLPMGIYKVKSIKPQTIVITVSDADKFESSKHIYEIPKSKLCECAQFMNKKKAREIYEDNGNSFVKWGAYTNGSYKKYVK